MQSEAGKGDKQRPTDGDKFRENWEKIFGNKKQQPVTQPSKQEK